MRDSRRYEGASEADLAPADLTEPFADEIDVERTLDALYGEDDPLDEGDRAARPARDRGSYAPGVGAAR